MKPLILLASLMLLVGCKSPFDNSRTVRYNVTGDCGVADINYVNATGGTDSIDDEPLPWQKTVEMTSGDWAYVSAWGWEGGTITASIHVDGDLKETETGSGETSCNAGVGLFLD